jgi:hypothetical protein
MIMDESQQVDTPIPTKEAVEEVQKEVEVTDDKGTTAEKTGEKESDESLTDRYQLPMDPEEKQDYQIHEDYNDIQRESKQQEGDSLEEEAFDQYDDIEERDDIIGIEDTEQKVRPKDTSGDSTVIQGDITTQEPVKPDSPMLDKTTKEKLLNLGQSLDSKKMHDAIAYIDLRQLCKGFSKAIMRHIDFSKGLYFTDDLKKLNELMEAEGFEASAKLDFSYNLDANMKINVDKLNEQARERKEAMAQLGEKKNEDNFSKMKEMMGGGQGVFEYHPQEQEVMMKEEVIDQEDLVEDDPMEYSQENLEDFMTELGKVD